jgi:hypothetical protein
MLAFVVRLAPSYFPAQNYQHQSRNFKKGHEGIAVIRMRREQRTFGDRLIEDEALYEDWMIQADRALEDEDLIAPFFKALGMRHPKSRSRGREGF